MEIKEEAIANILNIVLGIYLVINNLNFSSLSTVLNLLDRDESQLTEFISQQVLLNLNF